MHRNATAALIAIGLMALASLPALAQDYSITFKDGSHDPARLEVAAAETITIVLRNEGAIPVEFESPGLRKETLLAAGAETSIVLHGVAPGDYAFFDDFHPDAGKGVIAVK